MSKKRKTNHLKASRRDSGRVTPRPSLPDRSDDFFDIDLGGGMPTAVITAQFTKFGPFALPIPFVEWLDEKTLVATFDDYACQMRDDGIHGDAVTLFLEAHDADQSVIDEVQAILAG